MYVVGVSGWGNAQLLVFLLALHAATIQQGYQRGYILTAHVEWTGLGPPPINCGCTSPIIFFDVVLVTTGFLMYKLTWCIHLQILVYTV